MALVGRIAASWLLVAIAVATGFGLAWATHHRSAPTAGSPPIEQFDPERIGTIEQQAWEAYYLRDWPRLGALLWDLIGSSYRLSPAQAAQATMLATQAQRVWAERGAEGGEAERLMREFYALVREPAGGRYDPARAAALEIGWWTVHRQRAGGADAVALEDALAALWAEVYQLPPAAVRPAARHRARAMALSDEWVRTGREHTSPLLAEVRAELIRCYAALHTALDARRAAEEASGGP
ncbi:MAG TPA: hypothetical protein VKZ60_02350 [Chloroflexota bacterium]|nr:hypothetical protein [Chloroflexota bacterium]